MAIKLPQPSRGPDCGFGKLSPHWSSKHLCPQSSGSERKLSWSLERRTVIQIVPPLPTSTLLFIDISLFIHECSPKCTPNAHKLFFPLMVWLKSKICLYHRKKHSNTHAHALQFLLNPMIGVISSCNDDKLTLLPNSPNTNHRQTSNKPQTSFNQCSLKMHVHCQ